MVNQANILPEYPIIAVIGDDFEKDLLYLDSAGNPKILTGWSAQLIVYASRSITSNVLWTFSTANSTIVLGGTAGTIKITAIKANTLTWTWGSGYYHLQLTDLTPFTKTRLRGNFVVIF